MASTKARRFTFDITLSPSQQKAYELAHNLNYKHLTLVFSRQSGKTVLMMILCIEWLLNKRHRIAYITKNFTLAKKLFKELNKLLPKKYIKSSNASELTFEAINGSTLQFFSAEQGASLRGQTFTEMICDEFAFFKQEQTDGTHLWNDILSPTLKARGRKCIFVSTPCGKNNLLYTFFRRGESIEYKDWASLKRTIYDDAFTTPEEIDKIKKEIPDLSFRQEFLCEFLDSSITFFKGFEGVFDGVFKRTKNVWMGLDTSADGQDDTVLSIINEENVFKNIIIEGSLDEKYSKVARLIDEWKPVGVLAEINGVGAPMVNEIRKLTKYKNRITDWTTTNSTKEEIVSKLAVAIANKDVHFEKEDTKSYDELADFEVKVTKSKKLSFGAKSGSKDDIVLASSMALKAKQSLHYAKIASDDFLKTNWRKIE